VQPANKAPTAADRGRGTTPRADYFTASGCYQLRYEIEQFWRERGSKKINVWVEPVSRADPDSYVVRSNLRNGLPPDLTAADLFKDFQHGVED
jgi:hypothetical protein